MVGKQFSLAISHAMIPPIYYISLPLLTNVFRKSYKLLWCPVFKAASTNWMRNIITMAGLSDREKMKLEKKYKRSSSTNDLKLMY